MKPHSYVSSIEIKALAQLAYTCCHSVDRNNQVAPCISALFFARRPSAILLFVISIFIWKAIKAFPWRAFPHVPQKVFKQPPFMAHLDTASAVKVEKIAVRISASRYHVIPNPISFTATSPVSSELFVHQFLMQTSTGGCISRLERAIPHCQLSAATANHCAARFLIFLANVRRGFSDYFKSSKCFSNKGYCFWHERLSFNFQRLCKRWAASFNWRSLRQSCQAIACKSTLVKLSS